MKKNKLISVFLAGAFLLTTTLGLTACGEKNSDNKTGDGNISVVSREEGSGTRGAFIELVGIEEKNDKGEKVDNTVNTAVISNSTGIALTSVEKDSMSIGYVSLASLNDTVKALKIDGVEASADRIQDGTYPISRSFNLVTSENESDLAKDFINYILSTEGQKIVSGNGYISLPEAGKYNASKEAEKGGKVSVGGSSSVTPLMEKLAEAYKKINPNVEVTVQQSDSTTGVTSTIDKTVDIGMASRDLKRF
ncbi:substrate-binding domain-containing protein [Eubacteriales bacterium KG127]